MAKLIHRKRRGPKICLLCQPPRKFKTWATLEIHLATDH